MDNPSVDHLRSLGSQGTEYMAERPNSAMIETFDNPSPDADYKVEIEFPEFTSLCPKTGQPDFANIVIEYSPAELCVESKSLKLYLFAWRSEGSFMETITNKICADLVDALQPKWITVHGQFRPRGGMFLWPYVTWHNPNYQQ